MNKKEFTLKQVLILVLAIIAAIAILETPAAGAMWTWTFWRAFLLKFIVYGAVCEFVVIILADYLSKD